MKILSVFLLGVVCITPYVYTMPNFTLDQYKGVFVKDLAYEGSVDGLYYSEQDVFQLKQILQDKLAACGVPMATSYSAEDCDVATCEIIHQMDNIITVFRDCNHDVIYSSTAPFPLNPTVGTNEIPKIRPRIQSAYRRSLRFLDTYQYAYNPGLEPPHLMQQKAGFSIETFKEYLKSSDDVLEGIYENVSLAFPECVIAIRKEGAQYSLFYVEADEQLGAPSSIAGELHKAGPNGYEGHWILKEAPNIPVKVQWKGRKKLRVAYSALIEETIIFKKIKK